MKTSANTTDTFEELDYRERDGIEVSLLWSRADGSLVVAVHDARTAERFEIPVEPERVLDAFSHPFAYAAVGCAIDVTSDPVEEAVVEFARQTLAHL